MANKILRGNDLMIFKDTTGAGTAYKALAFSTSCQLSLTGNTLETSSKDGGKWTSKAVSKLSWSLTTDNLYSVEAGKNLLLLLLYVPMQIVTQVCLPMAGLLAVDIQVR